jgi:alpha-tubulin suppressor-like RCC1 family protein
MIRPDARAKILLAFIAALLTSLSGPAAAQASVPATQVAAGFEFTCVLSTLGGVSCFGQNNFGQLGDNSVMDRHLPVGVSGLGSGVVAIGAGQSHACALTSSGGVKCWGANYSGQLGDNSTTQQLTPVDVFGLTSGVAAIAVGPLHTCALTVGGGMKCWGVGIALGNGSSSQSNVPVDVLGLTSGVVAIGAGGFNSCALTVGSGVQCWGGNSEGELGDNSTTPRNVPGNVSGLLTGVSAIAVGGSHVCALTTAGGMKCWGRNVNGAVGDNSNIQRLTPVDVLGLTSGVAAITAGAAQTCALTSSGYMKCWGSNASGQLGNGDGSGAPQFAPVDVVGLGNLVAAISAGGNHTCARTAGGNVACWGDGYYGQLGDGTGTSGNLPVGVTGFSTNGVAQLGLGESHTCALTLAGGVKCWGFNNKGQLGNNSITQSLAPVDVEGLASGAAYIAASKLHTCAVTTSGGARCWGENVSGSLGDGTATDRYVPTDVFGLTSGVANVTMGSNHACALSTIGNAMCWGGNSLGVLGNGTYNQQLVPASVLQASPFSAISAGDTVTCALASGGVVQCWGANNAGQLGLGTLLPAKTNFPGNVLGLPSISEMDAGGDHACALTSAAGVKCWGANTEGQLGDGTLISRSSPVDVTGLTSGVAAITVGAVHTCALTLTGGVKCWGNNFFGELGDGSTTARSLPVDVVGLASGVVDIKAGIGHTCAITTVGGVKCWGHNLNGQLGDNSTTPRLTPVDALVGGQSIAFTPPALLAPGGSANLTATATSGLVVTFDTWTPGICNITGNTVTAISAGLCGVRASQAGNGGIGPAPQQLRLVPILDPSGDADNDGIPNAVEAVEGRNPLVKDNDVFSPGAAAARLFVMQQYRDFLSREGDAAGINGWVSLITAGTYSRLDVINAFFNSAEFNGFVAPVVRLYYATFLRVPDYAGLTFNAGLVRQGTITLPQLADFFTASPEFAATYGALDNTQFVTLLYNNVLGRAPDAAGLAGWVSLLGSGYTRGQVLLGFSESTEYQAAKFNEVYVTMMYVGMLRRSPEPGGYNGWLAYLNAPGNTPLAMINGFYLSTEYRGRFLP